MRDSNRIKPLLEKLQYLWEQYPDMRFGQLLESIIFSSPRFDIPLLTAPERVEKMLWNLEEYEWDELITKFEENMK